MDKKTSAVLLLSCPDQKGIVATVSNFIFQNNGNILHADEHLDLELNLFLMRVEWDLKDFALTKLQFRKAFAALAEKFQMDWSIYYSDQILKAAIFVSKEDHCLADLLYRVQSGELNIQISAIISNHPNNQRYAKMYNIPYFEIPINGKNRVESETKTLRILKDLKIDLIILAKYMQILSSNFISHFPNQIVNIHHSFLPAFIGAKPYHQAYLKGVKLIGATSHFVTAELDNGPIIEQDVVRISHRDCVEDLIRKGRDLEKIVLARAIRAFIENRILVYQKKTVVFL